MSGSRSAKDLYKKEKKIKEEMKREEVETLGSLLTRLLAPLSSAFSPVSLLSSFSPPILSLSPSSHPSLPPLCIRIKRVVYHSIKHTVDSAVVAGVDDVELQRGNGVTGVQHHCQSPGPHQNLKRDEERRREDRRG